MNYCFGSNDNESPDDLKKPNTDDKQSENSEESVYPESGCDIDYENEETLDFTKERAKESEKDKESSFLTKKRSRTPDDDLTEKFNQLHL